MKEPVKPASRLRDRRRGSTGLAVLFVSFAVPVHAGMTSYTLNEVVRLRMEDISFFALLIALCAGGLKLAWNHVAAGLPALPRLSWSRALCLTGILSLLMLLVLSMISGARELLTPGVWRRQGTSYQLNENVSEPLRRQSLLHLKAALEDYAARHGGRYPPHDYVPEIPEKLWMTPGLSGARYLYFASAGPGSRTNLLACEPENAGDRRFVLLGNGEIAQWTTMEIRKSVGLTP